MANESDIMHHMNEASQWRWELAQRIAPLYVVPHAGSESSTDASPDPSPQVILVGGSVSRNCADRYSDIEVGIFWTTPPTEDFRQESARRAGGTLYRSSGLEQPEQEEWSEEYQVAGVKLDVRHRLVSGVERWLSDVLDACETTVGKQVLLSALEHARPLWGTPRLEAWQARLRPYPPGLAEAMVREHLRLGPYMWLEVLAERKSVVELYGILYAISKRLLCVLMGLNGVYHPGFKWLDRLVADLPIAPQALGARLGQVFLLPPCAGVAALRPLIDETYHLVEEHLPSVDVAPSWTLLNQTIPVRDVRDPAPGLDPPDPGEPARIGLS